MQTADSRLRATVFSTIFQSRFSSLDRPPHCCSSGLAEENGRLPRCRPVLCDLRDRCIAAMLATQKHPRLLCEQRIGTQAR